MSPCIHHALSLLIAFGLAALLASCEGELYQGVLALRGNEPHSSLTLTTKEGKTYALTGPLAGVLMSRQKKDVSIRGRLIQAPVGPGFPARIEVMSIVETTR